MPRDVLDSLAAIVTDHDDPTTETGGIMVGHDRGWSIDVTGIGAPGPLAVHETARFNRDLAYASEVAADAWQRDRSQWIGEWHTHPGGRHAPSRFDWSSPARADTARSGRTGQRMGHLVVVWGTHPECRVASGAVVPADVVRDRGHGLMA